MSFEIESDIFLQTIVFKKLSLSLWKDKITKVDYDKI